MTSPAATGSTPAEAVRLRRMAAGVMELHWRADHGYTVPNSQTYPWQWLWDSCFHAIIWDALDDDRALDELAAVFAHQEPGGFVPHMGNFPGASSTAELWGIAGRSAITQPPMYGHALRVLATHGRSAEELWEPVRRGLDYLFAQRRAPCGLIRSFHPWETGADDSPRFDFGRRLPYARARWDVIHDKLAGSLERRGDVAVGNPLFDLCPASLNALVAWNALEAAAVTHDEDLRSQGVALARTIDDVMWSEAESTWRDVSVDGEPTSSIRVLEALLPALVTPDGSRAASALAQAVDAGGFGLPYGPAQVHPDEPAYEEDQYWRGPAWPQLTYLLWRAAQQRGLRSEEERLARLLAAGAVASGFAEYWNPATGAGLGAIPQSWTGLAIVPGADAARRG